MPGYSPLPGGFSSCFAVFYLALALVKRPGLCENTANYVDIYMWYWVEVEYE